VPTNPSDMIGHWPSSCSPPTQVETADLTFNSIRQLVVKEAVQANSGTIRVIEAPPSQTQAVKVSVSMAASAPYLIQSIRFIGDDRGNLLIDYPNLQRGSHQELWHDELTMDRKPCIWADITISIKPDLQLKSVNLNTTTLPIVLEKFGPSQADTLAIMSEIAADVTAMNVSARDTKITLASGDIRGTFALRDMLDLKTRTGEIDVDVIPQEAEGSGHKPAVLISSSYSGDIKIRFDTTDPPNRDYQVGIEAYSSDIQARLLHGTRTKVSGNTGNMRLDITPAYNTTKTTKLETTSNTGNMKVTVDDGVYDHFPTIKSEHRCTTGNIGLVYPQAWEGTITGSILTGTVAFKGKDLDIIHRTPFEIEARKGDGDSKVEFENHTGTVRIQVGEI
jgi:hypothetical protein